MSWLIVAPGVVVAVASAAVIGRLLRLSSQRYLTEGELATALGLCLPFALGICIAGVGLTGVAG